MTSRYRVEVLARHDRSQFSCGEPELDSYFRARISQDVRRLSARAFVAVETESGRVAGFYTLSATEIRLDELPPDVARQLAHYPRAPAILIGRLGVDSRDQGGGLGAALLADATQRVLAAQVGAVALVVDPKNAAARAFYSTRGWRALSGDERRLFLSLRTADRAAPS